MAVELQEAQKTAKLEDFDPPMKPKRNKFALACVTTSCLVIVSYIPSLLFNYSASSLLEKYPTGLAVVTPSLSPIQYSSSVSFTWVSFSPNYAFLMIGRFLAGVGVGFALMIVPVYTAEVSPTSPRYNHEVTPPIFHSRSYHYGWAGGSCSESIPNKKLSKGSLTSNRRLGSRRAATTTLLRSSTSKSHAKTCGRRCSLPPPAVRHIVVAIITIHFLQQAVGLDSVVSYSPTIFEKVGITSDSQKLIAIVVVGLTKTIFILVDTCLLDLFGRRAMLFTSFGGIIVSLFTLATCLTAIRHSDKKVMWAVY
ncbi:hypothetical protein K1719_005311 [Acacia pycnantha]|nr:hypothetical protein K1719_005311 [Acacia pycnantha]